MMGETEGRNEPVDSAGPTSGRWSPTVVFRPPVAGQGDVVILADATNLRRVAVKRTALLDALADSFAGLPPHTPVAQKVSALGFLGGNSDGNRSAAMDHWYRRGWGPALEYVLWTRACEYVDREDADAERRLEVLKSYLDAAGPPASRLVPDGGRTPLPRPAAPPSDVTLGKVLMRRRTTRKFGSAPVPVDSLSAVLHSGLEWVRRCRRTGPEEGNLAYLRSYGVATDFYLVAYGVRGLDSGLYYYDPADHTVICMKSGLLRKQVTHCLHEQPGPATAAWTLFLVADFEQSQWRYRHERSLRNLYIEAGRIGQQLIVAAGALGLGTFMTPAVRDREVCGLLALDPVRQAPLYSLTMGTDPRGTSAPGGSP